MRILDDLDALAGLTGEELGTSDWLTIEQDRVNRFAEATGDHQWIHVDPERAASGPFGAPIAHGFLTLSLIPVLVSQIYRVQSRMAINYGHNRVRFAAPVLVGSRVRATSELKEVTEIDGGVQVVTGTVIEIDGGAKPACAAETVSRYLR